MNDGVNGTSGRKIPASMENPLDNVLIWVCERLSPFFRSLGHTPNALTTYSLITGLGSVYSLWQGNLWTFAILWFVSYFFDCIDGYFARKYDMVTAFGDMYDHVKDTVVNALLFVVALARYRSSVSVWHIGVVVASLALMGMHLGCQERIYSARGGEDSVLTHLTRMCPDPDWIYATRWVGTGTFQVVAVALVVHLASQG